MRLFRDLLIIGIVLGTVVVAASVRDGGNGAPSMVEGSLASTELAATPSLDSQPLAQPGGVPEPGVAATPSAAAREIHRLRKEGRFDELSEFLVEDNRGETSQLIAKVDRVLEANRRLQVAADRAYGGMAGLRWDLAAMEDTLGLFSTNIEFISERFKGEKAYVTIQQGQSVPLFHAVFEQHADRWLHRPDPIPTGMANELDALAETLNQIMSKVERGAPAEYYAASFFDQVVPQMRRVATVGNDAVAGIVADQP